MQPANNEPVPHSSLNGVHDVASMRLPAPPPPGRDIDPFDVRSLRISPDSIDAVTLTRRQTTVPVRRPDKTWWVRVRAGEEHCGYFNLLELDNAQEIYLVAPEIADGLGGEKACRKKQLVTAINTQGNTFLWPLNLPTGSRGDSWTESATAAKTAATEEWTRVVSEHSLSAYTISTARGDLGEPKWSDQSFDELVRIAFRGRIISTTDHPVLQRLRGEIL